MIEVTINKKLKELVEQHRLSSYDLVNRFGLSHATWCNYLKQEISSRFHVQVLFAISQLDSDVNLTALILSHFTAYERSKKTKRGSSKKNLGNRRTSSSRKKLR